VTIWLRQGREERQGRQEAKSRSQRLGELELIARQGRALKITTADGKQNLILASLALLAILALQNPDRPHQLALQGASHPPPVPLRHS
jgi:hypothetical protein